MRVVRQARLNSRPKTLAGRAAAARASECSGKHSSGRFVRGSRRWSRRLKNRSRITKIVGHSSYARMTTRNVNTARKLAELSAGSS